MGSWHNGAHRKEGFSPDADPETEACLLEIYWGKLKGTSGVRVEGGKAEQRESLRWVPCPGGRSGPTGAGWP